MTLTLAAMMLAAAGPGDHEAHIGMTRLHHEMASAMADGEMSRAELSSLVKAQFMARDTDKDGALSGDELSGHMRTTMMINRSEPMKNGETRKWTTDDGKTIVMTTSGDVEGMALPDMEEVFAMADPAKAFDRMDVNKDGMLSREEFAKGREIRVEKFVMADGKPMKNSKMRGHGLKSNHAPMHMMHISKAADANKDGRVTLAEAEAHALVSFDKSDTNKDGKLSAEESGTHVYKVRKIEHKKVS